MKPTVALRHLCAALSRDTGLCARALDTIAANAASLTAVVDLAARERLLPALHEAVAAHGATWPKPLRIQLALAHEMNRRRNRAIRDAATEIAGEGRRTS